MIYERICYSPHLISAQLLLIKYTLRSTLIRAYSCYNNCDSAENGRAIDFVQAMQSEKVLG